MADNYFKSEQVEVFPSALRGAQISNAGISPRGKYTSERNFSNIVNSITNAEHRNYVIGFKSSGATTIGTLDVVLNGYFFCVQDVTLEGNLFFSIKIEKINGRLVSWDESTVLDDETYFKALYVSNSAPSVESNDYEIATLQVTNGGNLVNLYRLNAESVSYKESDSTYKSVKEKLDEKQNIVDAELPIKIVNGKTITFDDSEDSYVKHSEQQKIGDNFNPVYTDSEGKITSSEGNKGSLNTASLPMSGTNVYMKKGKFEEGQTFFISTESPTESEGKLGDFWFKYEDTL